MTTLSRRRVASLMLASGALHLGRTALAAMPVLPDSQAEGDAAALHVLNRLSFGIAPGDWAHVRQIGIAAYIDEQLHPERLPLPAALSDKLALLDSTRRQPRDLIVDYRERVQIKKDDSEADRQRRREFFQRMTLETGEARLWRALQSPRQLYEVMVDFWFNHFNVFIGKGLDRVLVGSYERDAIRPHALGNFRELLKATAHHPAMLFYLDNWLSVAPGYQPRGDRLLAAGPAQNAAGLNENYAREIMELHTLGVDGGYTQRDVTELARMLTGWTINPRRAAEGSAFYFDPDRHDNGDKQWLNHAVSARGQAEGEWAIETLAAHPATARHIAFKLAQYFVADAPPPELVKRVSASFASSGGDIRAVLKTLFGSPEFHDPAVRGVKFKTPYRYLLSAVRAANLPVINVRPLLATTNQLGMPLYGCQTPDGYKNTEEAWLNPDAITRRINFATALASGRLPLARPLQEMADDAGRTSANEAGAPGKYHPDWTSPPTEVAPLLDALGRTISDKTRSTIASSEPRLQAALVLGSPDFMHH